MYTDNFSKYATKFEIYPSVVKADEESTIRIHSKNDVHTFCDDTIYLVRLVPKDERCVPDGEAFSAWGFENICPVFEISPKNGVIEITYAFYGQQEWIIYIAKKDDCGADWWWTDSYPETRLKVSIYSLLPSLYGKTVLKGDLHIHTTLSDGKITPEEVYAAYRREGYDFMAITDHRVYNDGKLLEEKFSFADSLKIVPGEEVHEQPEAMLHMVSLGGKYCVSDIFKNNPEYVKEQLEIIRKNYEFPQGVDKTEYSHRIFVYKEIKKSGGYAVFPHPMWQLAAKFNSPLKSSVEVLKNGLCDAFELIGGCTPEGNNLQINLWNELRVEGYNYPVVGSSDAHCLEGETAFNEQYTYILADENEDVIDAIKSGNSVAVEAYEGENVRIYGSFEIVKYCHFLRRWYFSVHDRLCKEAGTLLQRYIEGDMSVKDEIIKAEERIKKFKREFFNAEEM